MPSDTRHTNMFSAKMTPPCCGSGRSRGTKTGFVLLETVVAIALLMMAAAAFIGVGRLALRAAQGMLYRTQAAFLLEEGFEAARTIRDRGWANIAALSRGVPYHFVFANAEWRATSSEEVLLGRFYRTAVFDRVFRDGADNIAAVGTEDPDTTALGITIAWQERGATTSISAVSYLANIFNE